MKQQTPPLHTAADLGKVVRDIRKLQGLTQSDLAGLAGTGRRFISDLERGKETMQLGRTIHILNALGISLLAQHHWKI